MVEKIVGDIMSAIEEANAKPKSREMSLVITKLEEALLWYGEYQRKLPRECGSYVSAGS